MCTHTYIHTYIHFIHMHMNFCPIQTSETRASYEATCTAKPLGEANDDKMYAFFMHEIIYRVFIKYCVFFLKCCDFFYLCQFCSLTHRGETERGKSPEYILKSSKNTIFYVLLMILCMYY